MIEFMPVKENRKLVDEVYRVLREAIITRKLKPRTKLKEKEISLQLKVSRTPVREALQKLAEEGLVIGYPHRSIMVGTLSEKGAIEIYELREVLEGLAARLAAKKTNEEQLHRLEQILIESEEYIKRGDIDLYAETNRNFHREILVVAGNDRLEKIVKITKDQMDALMSVTVRFPGKPQRSLMEHRAILNAFHEKNSAKAEKLMKTHIRKAKKEVVKKLRDTNRK